MIDDGQAVDLTGLTNEHVAAYLKQLFQSLRLQKTVQERIKDSVQQEEKDCTQTTNEDRLGDQYGPTEQKRRVLGPTMPSTEVLEAAARLTAAGPLQREADEDISMEPFVGPPPPAAVKEAESANEAERFEEVERILGPEIGNAYDLLGLKVGASAELMKKRYWKLSLLVHPDKCTHPKAHEAFTALNQAFKDLQDPMKRAKIDQQIQEKETREEFKAELKAKREAAEWRKIRGESLPGDDALLDTPKVMVRDEWMTQLPPERKAGAPTQQSTFFSRYAKSGRGDTSLWTDTPMDKVRKAKMAFLEGERQSMLGDESAVFRDPATAGIMDQFNSAKRGMSLVEKHQMERTKVKKAPNKKEAPQPAEWEVSHPWKPWDRDKDLTAGRQKVTLDKSNMVEGLSSRFAASHKERSFL
ncbi:hypothetical protein GOP47_0013505 [Adiantum capillus-veneris]|uniref:J domain-containing protein n=1 Tax=Adiantum capillus-veneris TaxID=13818 RepID=A0A9D4UNN1_ADICA|nr:hypothetical protein GOP47_0013505 [Adiantum capillus-veneris]